MCTKKEGKKMRADARAKMLAAAKDKDKKDKIKC